MAKYKVEKSRDILWFYWPFLKGIVRLRPENVCAMEQKKKQWNLKFYLKSKSRIEVQNGGQLLAVRKCGTKSLVDCTEKAQCRISTGTYSTRFFARCISLSWIACFYELTFVHLPFEILVFFLSAYFISLYSQHIKLDLSYLLQKLFPKLLFTLYF